MNKKYMIDGIDRLGKSSLIKRLQEEFGYHLVIHGDKPKVLPRDLETARVLKSSSKYMLDNQGMYNHKPEDRAQMKLHLDLSDENLARYIYQEIANMTMFNILSTSAPLIFDRTHLGEMVYAPLYRKYPGEYVFDIEKRFIKDNYKAAFNTRLILLTTSDTSILEDDGLSFDFSKKDDEQKMFIEAFKKSELPKIMVDVYDPIHHTYKSYEDIFQEVLRKSSQLK